MTNRLFGLTLAAAALLALPLLGGCQDVDTELKAPEYKTGLPAGEGVDADEFVAANKAAKKEGKKEAEYRPLKSYVTPAEAIMAYNYGDIGIHAPILVRIEKTID